MAFLSADPVLRVFAAVAVLALGMIFGSFATAVAHRVPRGVSWIRESRGAARSACPECGARLGVRDLVPVFSWVFLRGQCRHCRKPIPARYVLIELTTVLAVLGVYLGWGLSLMSVAVMAAIPFWVALGAILQAGNPLPQQLIRILAGWLAGLFVVSLIGLGVAGAVQIWLAPSVLGGAVAGGLAYWGAPLLSRSLRVYPPMPRSEFWTFAALCGAWSGVVVLPLFFSIWWGGIAMRRYRGERSPAGDVLTMVAATYFCVLFRGWELYN